MKNNIYRFEECLEIASENGGKNHLVLGNGFSVALFPKIFNYKVLAEKIKSEKENGSHNSGIWEPIHIHYTRP